MLGFSSVLILSYFRMAGSKGAISRRNFAIDVTPYLEPGYQGSLYDRFGVSHNPYYFSHFQTVSYRPFQPGYLHRSGVATRSSHWPQIRVYRVYYRYL